MWAGGKLMFCQPSICKCFGTLVKIELAKKYMLTPQSFVHVLTEVSHT